LEKGISHASPIPSALQLSAPRGRCSIRSRVVHAQGRHQPTVTAGDELSITVGKSTLVMKADGIVLINGSNFDFSATGPVQINGKDVDLN
jgi:uncharacterized protein (DUF2345 family)